MLVMWQAIKLKLNLCTLYIVHCTLYIVHCTLYIVHCTLYIVLCTLYVVHDRNIGKILSNITGLLNVNDNRTQYQLH